MVLRCSPFIRYNLSYPCNQNSLKKNITDTERSYNCHYSVKVKINNKSILLMSKSPAIYGTCYLPAMFSLKFNFKKRLVPLYSSLILIIFISAVSPGANDLHFYDGVSTADVIFGDVFFEILDPPELRYSYRIRPAKDFGAPFNESIKFERARLVPTIPLHSCSDIVNYEDIVGQIALSERGECSFVYKTAKAQQAGARAMIITESIDRWEDNLDHLIEMVDDKMELEVNIPAAFLLGRSGATILRTLRKLKKSYAVINLPINMTHVPISKMNQPPWIAW